MNKPREAPHAKPKRFHLSESLQMEMIPDIKYPIHLYDTNAKPDAQAEGGIWLSLGDLNKINFIVAKILEDNTKIYWKEI